MEASPVVWETCRNAAIGVGEHISMFKLDPFIPSTRGYLVTDGGFYYSYNLNAVPEASVAWTQSLSEADMRTLVGFGSAIFCTDRDESMNNSVIRTTFAQQGRIYVTAFYKPTPGRWRRWILWTDDVTVGGVAGWTAAEVTDVVNAPGSLAGECDLIVSQHDLNFLWFVTGRISPFTAGQNIELAYSEDGPDGLWLQNRQIPHQPFENIQIHCVNVPMFRDITNTEMFAIEKRAAAHAWSSDDGGASWTALEQNDYTPGSPTSVLAGGAFNTGSGPGREGLEESWIEAEAFWYAAGSASGSAGGVMRWSADIEEWLSSVEGGASDYPGLGFGVWQYDRNFQWMSLRQSATLIRTIDGWTGSPATDIDWSGNIATFIGANGRARDIQPVWTPVP